jgi:Glycosyl hydrolase family 1
MDDVPEKREVREASEMGAQANWAPGQNLEVGTAMKKSEQSQGDSASKISDESRSRRVSRSVLRGVGAAAVLGAMPRGIVLVKAGSLNSEARPEKSKRFPDKFLWGCATAGHQVEGNNTSSDLWALEHLPGSIFKEPSGDACDHYHLYPQDITLLADLGFNAYRFSLEWSRIEPEEGFFSNAELEHTGACWLPAASTIWRRCSHIRISVSRCGSRAKAHGSIPLRRIATRVFARRRRNISVT